MNKRRWAACVLAGLLAAPFAHAADPVVIAHRGASGYLPEHTLAGYELAVRLGADFIEPDLQLTSDGELVAIHDDTLQRTTNVATLFAQRNGGYKVADFTLAEIRSLTVVPTGTASNTYPGFTPAHAELRVPTFQEVITLAKSQGRSVGIYPEAKQADPVMEDKILATLQRNGYGDAPESVFLQSFSDATLRSLDTKLRALGLDLPLIVLGSAVILPDGTARLAVRGGAQLTLDDVASFTEGIGIVINSPKFPVTKAFIDQAHGAGLQVHGWTFAQSDPALAADEYRKYFEIGMDGVFSNYADLAVAARQRFGARPGSR
jgi:glycerophosphoryl diester phosphodiesterase